MNFQTGPATKAEIAQIAELEKIAFGEPCYPAFLFRQAYDLWPELLWCVRDEQQVVAYLLAAPMLHRSKVLNIMSVAVAPVQQGRGVGKLLVRSFCQSQQQKVDLFWLTVDPHNQSAQRLYQSLGFRVASYEDDYYHAGEPRLVMELELTNKSE
jgi:ribosomal protein S18 acetylase RimI-like enzyme